MKKMSVKYVKLQLSIVLSLDLMMSADCRNIFRL